MADEEIMKVDDEDGDVLSRDQKGFDAALDISRSGDDSRPKVADDSVKADRQPARATDAESETEEGEVSATGQEVAEEGAAEEQEAETAEKAEGEAPVEEPTYTLPGGIKVKASELFKDHERVQKLVTQANQMTHYQKLADDRKQELATQEQQQKSIYEQWVEMKMNEEMRAAHAAQQPPQAPPPPRPPGEQIRGAFMPYLTELVKQGRISEDHLAEDGGLISEYLYDQMALRGALEGQLSAYEQRIAYLEQQFAPVQSTVQAERVQSFERTVQRQLASTPGYEDFSDSTKWEQLKAFVGQEITAAGYDEYGNPNLRVKFDANRMRAFADAMMAPSMRAALASRRGALEERQKGEVKRAAGEAAGTGRQPKKKPQAAKTPEELAMDFSGQSVRKATG